MGWTVGKREVGCGQKVGWTGGQKERQAGGQKFKRGGQMGKRGDGQVGNATPLSPPSEEAYTNNETKRICGQM